MRERIIGARLNHVSIPATDLDHSERFYTQVLGVERLPMPDFGFPGRWLRLGALQIHLQFTKVEQPEKLRQHFAVAVDEFVYVYAMLERLGGLETEGRHGAIWELPCGAAQLFGRDPYGNLFEVNHPRLRSLDLSSVRRPIRVLAEEIEQKPGRDAGTLFLSARDEDS